MEQLPTLPIYLDGASGRHDDYHEGRVTSYGAWRIDRVKHKLHLAVPPVVRYTSVAAVGHEDVSVTVESNTDWPIELVSSGAFYAELEAQNTNLGNSDE